MAKGGAPMRTLPRFSNQGQVCGGAWRDRGREGANITKREREAILRKRLKGMAGAIERKRRKGKGLITPVSIGGFY